MLRFLRAPTDRSAIGSAREDRDKRRCRRISESGGTSWRAKNATIRRNADSLVSPDESGAGVVATRRPTADLCAVGLRSTRRSGKKTASESLGGEWVGC